MSKRGQPWMKFYGSDWRADAGLRMCSYAARGLWVDMLTLMQEAEPYGHLLINGITPDARDLSGLLGGTEKEVAGLVAMLEAKRVFNRTSDGVIYSRRMIRDHEKAELDRANGKGGGNPRLKTTDNPDLDPEDNPSSTGGLTPPVNPKDNGGDKAQKLEAREQKPEERTKAPPSTLAASDPPLSAVDLLWREGLPILRHLTGKSDGQARSMLGRLRRDVADDCPRLLLLLQQARDLQPSDPVAWLAKACGRSAGYRAGPVQPRRPATNGAVELLLRARERRAAEPSQPALEGIAYAIR